MPKFRISIWLEGDEKPSEQLIREIANLIFGRYSVHASQISKVGDEVGDGEAQLIEGWATENQEQAEGRMKREGTEGKL